VAVGTDADLIQVFADKHASFAEVPVNPIYVLVKVDGSNSWNDRDLNLLAALSADDYERIIMECTGDRLHPAVSGALRFSCLSHATPAMQGIANNARAAASAHRKDVTAEPHAPAKIRRPGRPRSKFGGVAECLLHRCPLYCAAERIEGCAFWDLDQHRDFCNFICRSELVSIADRLYYAALFQLR
jgi:hypothetical protein